MRRLLLGALALVAACGDRWTPPAPGLVLQASGGLTTEGGGSATLQVSLLNAPTAAVAVDVVSSDSSEGAVVDPSTGAPAAWVTLVFTPADWSVPRSLTVVGVDDDARDGDVAWSAIVVVQSSADGRYAGLDATRVAFTNQDDDSPSVRLSRTSVATWEAGQTTDSFTVVLGSRPASTVTLPIVSARPEEGLLRSSTSPLVSDPRIDLVFTPSDWSTPREVTVVGQGDAIPGDDVSYSITVGPATGDADYAGLPAQTVSAVNRDPSGSVLGASLPSSLTLSEGSDTELCVSTPDAPPTADVSIPIQTGDATEVLVGPSGAAGPYGASLTVTLPGGVSFPSVCFSVRAVRDHVVDGARLSALTIGPTASADASYDGHPARRVEVTTLDADVAGVAVDSSGWQPIGEDGTTSHLSVVLTSQPASEVRIPVVSYAVAEALVSVGGGVPAESATLIFTPADWADPHVVTVHGVDDPVWEPEPPHTFSLALGPPSSLDEVYGRLGFTQGFGSWNVDDDGPPPEGTASAPLELTGSLPWHGAVGRTASYYAIHGLADGALVSVRNAIAGLAVTVDDDGDFASGALCTFSAGGGARPWCVARVPASGALWVKVDGSATNSGTWFDLDVEHFYVGADVPKAIPDASDAGVSSSIQVSGAPASLSAVRVTLDATHAFAYDLEATLVSPAGTRIPLFACIYAANYPRGYPWTVFDANAVSSANGASSVEQELKPIGALESLAGEDGNGTWRQELVDRINPGYAGQLLDWGVSLR